MMHRLRRIGSSIVILMAMRLVAFAQEYSVGEAEVVAIGQQTTPQVFSLDSTSILQKSVTSVADALRRMPGVNVRDYGGAGGLKTVSVRGLSPSYTTVIVDGMPVGNVQQGAVDLSHFHLSDLSRISLHTNNRALLLPVKSLSMATLHLTTTEASSDSTHETHGMVGLRQGSWKAWEPTANISVKHLRHALSTSGHYYQAHNNYPFLLHNGSVTTHERRNHSEMHEGAAHANYSYSAAHTMLTSSVSYFQSNRHLPGIVTLYNPDNGYENLKNKDASAQLMLKSKDFKRCSFFAGGKFNWQESRYRNDNPSFTVGDKRQNYWQRFAYFTGGVAVPLIQKERFKSTMAYASDFEYSYFSSNLVTSPSASRNTWQQALSLESHAQFTQASVILKARGLHHQYWNHRNADETAKNFGRLTPSVSITWQQQLPHKSTISSQIYYKALFRAPTFSESYYYHLGSTTLQPELAKIVGISTHWQGTQRHVVYQITVNGYLSNVTNRITSIPYNLFIWRTINMGHVQTYGFDISAYINARILRSNLIVSGSYSLQHTRDITDATTATYQLSPAYCPDHSGSYSVAWENPWVNVSISGTGNSVRWSTNEHISETKMDGFIDYNCSLYRTFRYRQFSWLLRTAVLNVFNRQYEIVRRYPMPGRSYQISIQFNY